MQSATQNPLFLDEKELSIESQRAKLGERKKRQYIIENLGKTKANINLWISSLDLQSKPLEKWSTFDPPSLELEAGKTGNVTLIFDVPAYAEAITYNYEILIKAPLHYPDSPPFRRSQQLRVFQIQEDLTGFNQSEFIVQPATNASNPHLLNSGERLEVTVTVRNLSDRTDRFYLTCPDLDKHWYAIKYPESDLDIPGLVRETQGLELNPGQTGKLLLYLSPPRYTPAGIYNPTLRLISNNKSDAVMLDIIYLQIEPDDSLEVEMSPLVQTIPQKHRRFSNQAEFVIQISNEGNIEREILMRAKDLASMFTYTFAPCPLQTSPGTKATVVLVARLRRWKSWLRPFWGKGWEIPFDVELENANSFILAKTNKPPRVAPSLPPGRLIWKARPLWVISLIIFLILLGFGILLWKLLYLPPLPKISKIYPYSSEGKSSQKFQEDENTPVQLHWEIERLSQLSQLQVTAIDGEGQEASKATYVFNAAIPQSYTRKTSASSQSISEKLPSQSIALGKDNAEQVERVESREKVEKLQCISPRRELLSCDLSTTIEKAGKYNFRLELFPIERRSLLGFRKRSDRKIADAKKTDIIEIANPKKILQNLFFNRSVYQQATKEVIIATWDIFNIDKLKPLSTLQVLLTDRKNNAYKYNYKVEEQKASKTLSISPILEAQNSLQPPNLDCSLSSPKNLVCQVQINSIALAAEDYQFKIELSKNEKTLDTLESLNPLKIIPKPEPPFKISSLGVSQASGASPNSSSLLSWEIGNPKNLQSLTIKAISADGKSVDLKRYQYPNDLRQFCEFPRQPGESMKCKNVPTGILPQGEYSFQLVLETQSADGKTGTLSQNSGTVKVNKAPYTMEVKVNDQPVLPNSSSLYPIQFGLPVIFDISWVVKGPGSEGTKVELLPFAGEFGLSDSYRLTLSPEVMQQNLILQVSNQFGVLAKFPLSIQTYDPNRSVPSQSSPSEKSEGERRSPSTAEPSKLEPLEKPPVAN
ncbi:hypothetical protein [Oscillatoria sp. FACHB-1406]|uniref:COG1470 family protein n=1 Tax=Oscillatoria sp. FACHB-1406 TaxID=2692846 RepID=UPI001689FBCE|nr:hypothetical protein [Oscillatoria sp. FACHB-1406]MBD2576481.1 hypothetical protein [Oscillatoria sp. FACHB-1406]